MNETLTPPASNSCASIDACVKENPGRSLLIAAGVGLAIGVILRAMQTPPPATRLERLMADIQGRLHDLGNRASHLADDGVGMIHEGADRVRDLHFERPLRAIGQRVRSLFS